MKSLWETTDIDNKDINILIIVDVNIY